MGPDQFQIAEILNKPNFASFYWNLQNNAWNTRIRPPLLLYYCGSVLKVFLNTDKLILLFCQNIKINIVHKLDFQSF